MPTPLFTTRFFFIRHGESVANKAKLFAGQMDVELTDKGKVYTWGTSQWCIRHSPKQHYSQLSNFSTTTLIVFEHSIN